MSTESGFEDLKLENSILCKHHKIAGRVETVFCEASPIRLSNISPLKRLGPGCCTECHQYNCTCLWDRHTTAKCVNSRESHNPQCCSESKWAYENSMLYRLKKRNFYCGNMNSRHMQCVMRPVPKMHFSESEENSATIFNEIASPKKGKCPCDDNDFGLKPTRNLLKSKAHCKFDKNTNREYHNSAKEYFNGRAKILDEALERSSQNAATSTQPNQLPVNKVSLPLRKNTKYEQTTNADCLVPVQIMDKQTKLPRIKSGSMKEKNSDTIIPKDYTQRINNIINSRCALTSQTTWNNNISLPAERDLPPKHIEMPQSNKNIKQQTKANEFLMQESPKFARTIDSLENMHHSTSTGHKREKAPSMGEYKKKFLWGSPLLIEKLNDDAQPITINNPPNSTSRIYQNAFNIINPPEKSFSNVAIQTEQLNTYIPLSNEIECERENQPERNPSDAEYQKAKINKEKTKPFTKTEKASPIVKSNGKRVGENQSLEKNLNNNGAKNNENPLKKGVSMGFTKVKTIAALFEAEIQANIAKAKAYEPKNRNKLGAKNGENLKPSLKLNCNTKPPSFLAHSNETKVIKSKDSGILTDQAINKSKQAQQMRCETYSNCSVITVVSKD